MSTIINANDTIRPAANPQTSLFQNINKTSVSGKTVFAGSLKLPSMIDEKKEAAQKQAMKIVTDAFSGDRSLDKQEQSIRDDIKRFREENLEYQREIQKNETEVQELAKEYGVHPDSQEQKDLELLHKRSMFEKGISSEMPTPEEKERLAQIDKNGMTEYQTRAMGLFSRNDTQQKKINDNNLLIQGSSAALSDMEIERLKTHPVLDAKKQADAIMEAASDEIKSMAIQGAKDHIDQLAEEEKERAKEKKEEKEEQEEKLDALAEKKAEMEALIEKNREHTAEPSRTEKRKTEDSIEDVLENAADLQKITAGQDTSTVQDQVNSEIQNILNKLSLLSEDIKGAAVDEAG